MRDLLEADEETRATITMTLEGGTIRQQWQAFREFKPFMERIIRDYL